MKWIATAKEIKEIENSVIADIGIPSLVLMERAAMSVTGKVIDKMAKKAKICILCGGGNNGADGVAIARQLMEQGYKPDVVLLAKEERFSKELKMQVDILAKLDVIFYNKIPDREYDCYIDAIFGIGLTRDITDTEILNVIKTVNASDAYIYSVDIPTGIHTDTGKIMGAAIKADETITFTCEKIGLCLYPGKEYAGKIHCHNIGIMESFVKIANPTHYGVNDILQFDPLKEFAYGNKGTYGKVAVIAGNTETSGAALLCAKAAFMSGAGMVKVLSEDKTLDVIRVALPEAMVASLEDENKMESTIKEAVKWANCIVIGPGIGNDYKAYLKMFATLKDFPQNKVLVVDADGINLLAKHKDLKEMTELVNNIVYTPHMMEFSRMTGFSIEELKTDLDSIMSGILEKEKAIYVCKDSVTRVYTNERPIYINKVGNSGMATAGSGDVLAGMIAAFTGRKDSCVYDETIRAVFLHSYAGDMAANELGKNSLLAGDIIRHLSIILRTTEEGS